MSIIKVNSKKAKSGYTYKVDFRYKEYGVTQRYTQSGFKTKKEASTHENMVKAQIKKDGYLKKICTKTLNEVYCEALELQEGKRRKNTLSCYQITFNKYIKNTIGETPIAKISYPLLQKYFNSLSSNGKSTNANIKKVLSIAFKHAVRSGYIESNPLTYVDTKGKETKKDTEQTITYDQLESLVSALLDKNSFKHEAMAIALYIGYYTGARISEALAFDKNDFDFANNEIIIGKQLTGRKKSELKPTHDLKTSTSKAILPLPKPLKQVLIEWFEKNPYDRVICDVDGSYLYHSNVQAFLRKEAQKLGFDFHYHMLRHTYVSNLAMSNNDIKTVQTLARHSNISTTMNIYTHVQKEKQKEAINNAFNTNYPNFTPKIKVN